MKLTLALALVSLSVLTAAKHDLVRRRKDPHYPGCGNSTAHPGNITHPGNTTIPGNITHPGNTTNPGNYTNPSTPVQSPTSTPSSTPTASGSPANTPTPKVAVATTAKSSGWVQNPKGNASFTAYSGCQYASCGQRVNGLSAAVNELAFGANSAAGGACGRCFKISANHDPYTPSYSGSMGNTIVVKANDLCPAGSNNQWCGQTVSHPLNYFGDSMHFDLCTDSGAPEAFFPGDRRAMLGTYEEVSCSEWSGTDGDTLWNGSCLAGESAPLWPAAGGCPNTGTPPA